LLSVRLDPRRPLPEGTHTWNVTVAPAGTAGAWTNTCCVPDPLTPTAKDWAPLNARAAEAATPSIIRTALHEELPVRVRVVLIGALASRSGAKEQTDDAVPSLTATIANVEVVRVAERNLPEHPSLSRFLVPQLQPRRVTTGFPYCLATCIITLKSAK